METLSKFNVRFTKGVGKIEGSRLFSKFGKKTWWMIAVVALLVIGGSVAYYQMTAVDTETATTDTLQTTVARKSDLILYASGTGTLIAVDEVDLGFTTSGQVNKINVKVGDTVKAGDVLATINDSSTQIKYIQAKRTLLELTSVASVAAAEEAVAAAQTEVVTAVNQVSYLISPAVYYWETEVESATLKLEEAKAAAASAPNDAELQAAQKKRKSIWIMWKINSAAFGITTIINTSKILSLSLIRPADLNLFLRRRMQRSQKHAPR
ncbi:biotin/lipoyl-binding protein [Candidatus Villigracilis proximus]|uniref:biotin/lipoyl-binding protein n=1 Tax=Candidatus Villigracilis proximus TaxID=3140683 RepID=UPI0031F12828